MTLRLSEQHSYNDVTSIQAGVAYIFYYNTLIEHSIIINKNSQELKKVKMVNSGLRQHSVRVFYYKEKVI